MKRQQLHDTGVHNGVPLFTPDVRVKSNLAVDKILKEDDVLEITAWRGFLSLVTVIIYEVLFTFLVQIHMCQPRELGRSYAVAGNFPQRRTSYGYCGTREAQTISQKVLAT